MRNADVRIWVGSGLLDHARQKARLDRLRDAGASLFFGGIAAVAGQADWAVAGLSVGPGGLRLHAAAPAGTEALRESHGPFFPGLEEAELPQVEDTLATFVLPRVLGPWWTSRDLYLTPEAVSSSVEADTNLTTVFQRDFGTEVLHRLAPGLRVVVARAPFLGDRPAVEFPAAALGLRARPEAAEEMAAGFYNAFSIVINLTNFDRPAMGDQRLQMAEPELQEDGARIYSARYAGAAPGALLPPRYNLSPALLLRPDGEIWISSSLPLLRRIAAAPRDKVPVQGDRLRVDLRPGRAIFAADRDALLARKVLQQGGDVQAAGAELDALAAGLELFDSAALDARLGAGLFQLELSLEAGRDEETGR